MGIIGGTWRWGSPGPKEAGLRLRSRLKPAAHTGIGVLALLVLMLPAIASPVGGAAQEGNAAGIVVDYGDGRVTYAWVPFVEEEISGIELLRRSGVPLVSVSFGGLGEGVCMVGDTGCGVTECRRRLCQTGERSSPFWQYVRQEAPGEWRTFSFGASQSSVRDGDIDGWAWTGNPPRLPAITLDEVRRNAGGGDETAAAVVRTFGGEPVASDDSERLWRVAAGAGVVVAIGGAGGVVVWRSRRMRRRVAP